MNLTELTDVDLELLAERVNVERARRARLRVCRVCGDRFDGRAGARYCSTRCRVSWHRTMGLPADLRRRARWVRFDETKRPLQVDGRPASSTDPGTWSTFDEARASSAGAGVGFVLNGDGLSCIDLDGVLIDGVLDERAAAFIDALEVAPFYMEVSPSGRGLHLWTRQASPTGRSRYRLDNGLPVEWYSSGRYLTVTGERAPSLT